MGFWGFGDGQQWSGWNAAFATEPHAPLGILKSGGALLEERGFTFQKNDEARVSEISAVCDDRSEGAAIACLLRRMHFCTKIIFISLPIIDPTSPDGVKIGEALRRPFWLLGSVEDGHF